MPEITGQTSAAAPYRIDTQLHQLLYKQPSRPTLQPGAQPEKLPDSSLFRNGKFTTKSVR